MSKRSKAGFTLVEIMIVVAIIGLLAVIAIPSFVRARQSTQANSCVNNLRQIDGARTQYALEHSNGTSNIGDLVPEYIRRTPFCPSGGTYATGGLNGNASCSIGGEHAY